MKYTISDLCVGCHACSIVCPNNAVYQDADQTQRFHIHPKRCNGCHDQFSTPQCATICPIEAAILDDQRQAVNPIGSLSGITE